MVAHLQGETGHSYEELMAMDYGRVLKMNLNALAVANAKEEAMEDLEETPS